MSRPRGFYIVYIRCYTKQKLAHARVGMDPPKQLNKVRRNNTTILSIYLVSFSNHKHHSQLNTIFAYSRTILGVYYLIGTCLLPGTRDYLLSACA